MSLGNFVTQKLFASSRYGEMDRSTTSYVPLPYSIENLKKNPTANRCLNMIIDAAAGVNYEIKSGEKITTTTKVQPATVKTLLNRRANPQTDANYFKRSIITDLITTGNAYILVDGSYLYYLPAIHMTVTGHSEKLVDKYTLNGTKDFDPSVIIHIKDNSTDSILTGRSRLPALADYLDLYAKMKSFQKNFFNNNAMPGIVLVSPNTLTEKLKQRKLEQWSQDFNPTSGARKPAFLDGGIEIQNLQTSTFREMDFETSIQSLERDIARAMGVPPILMDGGNNANISPNLRLFYLETIMPICVKIANAFSLHYGYDIKPDEVGVTALQPDLRDLATYAATLTNGGIMYPNEARESVGLPADPDPESNKIRIPANVAGSAVDPSKGGKPKEPQTGDE